jgi:hypothetical protein
MHTQLNNQLFAFSLQELHGIKLAMRQRLAMLSLPLPSPADAAQAAAAGVLAGAAAAGASQHTCIGLAAAAAACAGVRLFGLPDPSCGGVPEGCVAVRQELVPPAGWAVIYRCVHGA